MTEPEKTSPTQVAVIGGGFTGMTAARRLALLGHDVTLYEASPRLGGLASGFAFHGTSIEHTYHHIFNTDTSIIELARELGVEDTLTWFDSSVGIWRDGKVHPFNGALDLLRFRPLRLWNRIRVGLVALRVQRAKRWEHLVDESAYDWMRARCGEQAMQVIWEPLLRGKFHKHYRTISMAWLWSRLNIRTNSRDSDGQSEQLGYFRGGFAVISDALERELERLNVDVLTTTTLRSIASSDDGGVVLEGDDGPTRFDRALATVPSYILAGLLRDAPAEYVEQLRSVEYLGAVVSVFSTDQDLGDTYWINVNDADAPFLVLLQHTRLAPAEWYEGRHVYYIGAYVPHDHEYFTQPDEAVLDTWFEYARRMFPTFDPSRVQQCHLGRYRNAQHVTDIGYAAKVPEHRTPVPGLFLANFSQLFPVDRGTNFAVRDGERVALMVDESIQSVAAG